MLFSRGISLKQADCLALVPYADLLNHSPYSQSYFMSNTLPFSDEWEVVLYALTLTLALILTLQARHAAAGTRQQPRRRTARATGHRAARLRPERLPLDGPAQGRQLLRHDPRHVRRQPRQPVQARRVLGVARVCLLMG